MGISSFADEGVKGQGKGVPGGVIDHYREHILNHMVAFQEGSSTDTDDAITDGFYECAVNPVTPANAGSATSFEVNDLYDSDDDTGSEITSDSYIIHLRQDHIQDVAT